MKYKFISISNKETHPLKSVLAMSLSALMTSTLCVSTSSFASDIEIYQEAKSGDITLMFMLDISKSMDDKDGGSTTRIARVKDAMKDLLSGNATKKITKIDDDKIIGLSILGSYGYDESASILVPARKLSTLVGGVTQRQILLNNIDSLTSYSATPTARSYAEVGAYLLGTNTTDFFDYETFQLEGNFRYRACKSYNTNRTCSSWGSWWSSALPKVTLYSTSNTGLTKTYKGPHVGSGFYFSDNTTKDANKYNSPSSLTQTDAQKKCSGQGIYVLTDGVPNFNSLASSAMKNALGSKGSTFSCTDSDDGWDCTQKFNDALLNPGKNPKDIKFKTAVVGFGNAFNNVSSYDRSKTQKQNLDALGTIDTDVKRAAEWGIKGEGGWYAGNSSQDVVDSVNNFINDLGAEIPAVTTGTPTIPSDELNPIVLQNYAYYPQFEPMPEKTYQHWSGNLKKYNVDRNGKLLDKLSNLITDAKGKIIDNYDLWSPTVGATPSDVQKTAALVGGVKMQLELRHTGTDAVQRKLFTTRGYTSVGVVTNTDTLQQVKVTDLDDNLKKKDQKIGYLMNLLGYSFDPKSYLNSTKTENTLTKVTLLQQPELRQVGAVMHSSPVLLTNQGKITYNDTTNVVGSENRKDFILFGTTQGLLHVVDAISGKEKFAFVPNELVESQAEAFNKPELTSGGMNSMYYGVDGPWTAYTEYVIDKNNTDLLSVGEGKPYTVVENNQNVNKTVKGKQIVYGGLRMGGKGYYALDLADIDAPKLQFQINPTGTCSTENPLGCMGQSWSKPTITWVNWKGVKRLVMFVGGGYDAEGINLGNDNHKTTDKYRGYEYDDYVQSNKIGAGVYMFDALNGDLLWWTGANATESKKTFVAKPASQMAYSVVSQIRTIDRDSDGLTDHLYFGDLGGQVWRIDLNNQAGSETDLFTRNPTPILNLNKGKYSPRFYETPAFSTYTSNGQIFGLVSIGSGNRSKPLSEYTHNTTTTGTDTNYSYDGVFNIYDKDVARESLLKLARNNPTSTTDKSHKYSLADADLFTKNIKLQPESMVGITTDSKSKLLAITDATRFPKAGESKVERVAPYALTSGWYYNFNSQKVQSEKVMSTPIVINNDMYVTTFDGSKPGLSGDCGAGVKGESFMTLFCMPFGQCNSGSVSTHRLNLGAGIVGGAVGAGDSSGMQRLIVVNVDTTKVPQPNNILNARYNTINKLIPQRWYERR
jgi:type IV pilus assembly protein PilY1